MNVTLSKIIKPDMLFRMFLYFAAGCITIILSNTVTSAASMIIFPIISAVFCALLFAGVGLYAYIPLLIPVVIIGFVSGIDAVLSTLVIVIVSSVLGISIKNNTRPSFTIAYTTSAFALLSAAYIVISSILATGSFSVTEFFNLISDSFDSVAAAFSQAVSQTPELGITIDAEAYSTVLKSVFAGVYIAVELILVCIYYYLTLFSASIFKDPVLKTEHSLFDIKPTVITVWVYMICLVLSPAASYGTSVHFYTHLTTNILTVLCPLFFFSGMYYITRIKFRKERSSPLLLIIAAAATVFFGLFSVLLIYVIYCGIVYSIRYRIKNTKNTTDNLDERK